MKIQRSITIHRPSEELYGFWHSVDNLAELAPGDASAKETSHTRSHWTARVPGGRRYEWDVEITDDVPGRVIGWRSLPGGDVSNSGSVRFEPIDDAATRVEVQIEYAQPGGFVGRVVGTLVHQQVQDEVDAGLERAKRRLEGTSFPGDP